MNFKNTAYLLLGATAGAILGVLFAPRPGKETRTEVKDWLDEKREKSAVVVEDLRKSLPEQKEKLNAVLDKGRKLFTRNGKEEAEKIETKIEA